MTPEQRRAHPIYTFELKVGWVDERGYLTAKRLLQGSEEHRIVPVEGGEIWLRLRSGFAGRAAYYVSIYRASLLGSAPRYAGIWWFDDLREAQDAWAGDELLARWALGDRGDGP